MKAADVAEPDNVDDAGDPDADDGRGARPTMPTKDQLSEPVKLLRDLLERSAEEYSYVTIPDPDADAMFDCPILAFQLLTLDRKVITVHTFQSDEDKAPHTWSVQPLAIWNFELVDENNTEIDVFPAQEPARMDVLSYFKDPLLDRHRIRVWECGESHVEACFRLHSPKPLVYNGLLTANDAPVLAIEDRLRKDGYVHRMQKIRHTRRSGLYYDGRAIQSARCYLQCLLASKSLYDRGLTWFESGKSATYYRLLLRSPSDELAVLTNGELRDKLRYLDPSVVLPALPAPGESSAPLALNDLDGDSGDDMLPVPKVRAKAKPKVTPVDTPVLALADDVVADPVERSSSDSSSSSSTSNDASLSGDDVDGGFPRHIEGAKLKRESHEDGSDEGFRVTCVAHGAACARLYRSRKIGVERYGPQAAVIYLGCWLKLGHTMPCEKHKVYKPTHAAMRKYLEEQ